MIVPDRRISWFRLLFQVRGSALPRIRGRLLAVFAVACIVTYLSNHARLLTDLTPLPFNLIGLALGVFLGFRNNASYDRYWEGRRLWGRLVNDARSFARLVLDLIDVRATPDASLDAQAIASLRRDLVYRAIAFTHALRLHLRGPVDDLTPLRGLLPEAELAGLTREYNVPLAIVNGMGRLVTEARFHGVLHSRDVHLLENLLSDMVDVQGGCERIRATPIPWSYTLLIHSIVAAYCFSLPFGLVSTTKQLTPVVVLLIAYAFLGLDAVGDELEEPFGTDDNDLPLMTISRTVEVNLRQMLGEENLPELLVPDVERILR
ncbi:MAG: bestrophin family ion channel [Myxococcales bacterium]